MSKNNGIWPAGAPHFNHPARKVTRTAGINMSEASQDPEFELPPGLSEVDVIQAARERGLLTEEEIQQKVNEHKVRYYQEPTFVFDD